MGPWFSRYFIIDLEFRIHIYLITYVPQFIKDTDDMNVVNEQLDKMGHNIGIRIIDEYLAKSGTQSCANFRDTAEMIGKVAFKMFLGITAEVTNWSADGNSFSLVLVDNPLVDFVEIPPQFSGLHYCNVLCGVIRGALEMVQLQVACRFVRDVLKGDEVTELRVELKGMVRSAMGDEYKEN